MDLKLEVGVNVMCMVQLGQHAVGSSASLGRIQTCGTVKSQGMRTWSSDDAFDVLWLATANRAAGSKWVSQEACPKEHRQLSHMVTARQGQLTWYMQAEPRSCVVMDGVASLGASPIAAEG